MNLNDCVQNELIRTSDTGETPPPSHYCRHLLNAIAERRRRNKCTVTVVKVGLHPLALWPQHLFYTNQTFPFICRYVYLAQHWLEFGALLGFLVLPIVKLKCVLGRDSWAVLCVGPVWKFLSLAAAQELRAPNMPDERDTLTAAAAWMSDAKRILKPWSLIDLPGG